MKTLLSTLAVALISVCLVGCGDDKAEGPPRIRLGDSLCVECNMIISDARFATATVVRGPRGPEALLFDDFNCQVNHEKANPDAEILARWSHDHGTSEWLRTENAHFVRSDRLRTPMASFVAAFRDKPDAEAMQRELGGDITGFETMRKRLLLNGPCCPSDGEQP